MLLVLWQQTPSFSCFADNVPVDPVVSSYLQCHQYLRFCKKTFYTVVIASLIGIIDGGQRPSWILNIVNFNNYRPFFRWGIRLKLLSHTYHTHQKSWLDLSDPRSRQVVSNVK